MNPFTLTAPLTIEASAEGQPPQVRILAYSGGSMPVPGFGHVVIDLAGMELKASVPLLADHQNKLASVAGQGVPAIANGQLLVSGTLTSATDAGTQILAMHRDGITLQASVGADPLKSRFIKPGESVTANGQTIQAGPMGLTYVSKSRLREVTLCAVGCDPGTVVSIAAQKDLTNMADDVLTAERQRVERIEAACKGDWGSQADHVAELKAAAVNGSISFEGLQGELLTCLREKRPKASQFSGRSSGAPTDGKVIEAALAMSAGLPNLEKAYSPETLQAVDDNRMRHFGLQQLLIMAAAANGYDARPGERITMGNLRSVLQHAFLPDRLQASGGFSTISLPGILGNVANKELVAGFAEEDQTWREVAAVKSVNNLLQYTSYRMTDDFQYQELGPTGEIAHSTLTEDSYTRQAKMYARMLGLSRESIINDDLSAMEDVRTRIGAGGAKALNEIFWAKFINNSSYFTSGNGNYTSGATTNLGTDGVGLGLALLAFRQMESADGKRIGGEPVVLLVPPEIEGNADRLYTGGNSDLLSVADTNPYRGKYKPVVQVRLSDSSYTGYSTTAFYLLRNPAVLAAMVVSFLNGQQQPTVESAEADFNTLGIQFRGYFAFGCDWSDYKLAGIKSKGAA